MIQIGDEAPDFLGRSIDNKGIWLRSLRGRPVVLCFFPKALTQSGAADAGRLHDHTRRAEIRKLGAECIGISIDGLSKQSRPAAGFPIVSDGSRQIARSYDILRSTLQVNRALTYVIDEVGVVEAMFEHEISPTLPIDAAVEHLWQRTPQERETAPPRTSRTPGEIIADRYRLKRLLAEGGIGEVWVAEHMHLRQDVAIKLLKESSRQSPERAVDLLERFRLESQIAALLGRRTAHVVGVQDAGFSEVGPFLAMELVDGKTLLDELHTNGPMSPERFLPLLEQVVDALGIAHAGDIVHRDLKPSNILLQTVPGGGFFVKLADFGLAKSTSAALTLDRPQDTSETVVMGTVEYMSPEQLRGAQADPRIDVWALGVVAYQMLTGSLPFSGASRTSVMATIIARPFPPVSKAMPGLPDALNDWFSRALAKEPSERFASAQELLQAYRSAIGAVTTPQAREVRAAQEAREAREAKEREVNAPTEMVPTWMARQAQENAPTDVVAAIDMRRACENAPTELMPSAPLPTPGRSERRRQMIVATGAAMVLGAAIAWLGFLGAPMGEDRMASQIGASLLVSVGAGAIAAGTQIAAVLPSAAPPAKDNDAVNPASPPAPALALPAIAASAPPSAPTRPSPRPSAQLDPSAVF